MNSGIYQILNVANGKQYVGSAVNLRRRRRSHLSGLVRGNHCNHYLQRAWNLYGGEAFAFSVLEYVLDLERLLEREQHYLDALEPEYNIAQTAGSSLGCVLGPPSEEHKQKLRDALRGRVHGPHSEERRRKIGEAQRGRVLGPQSEEHRQRISEANKGRVLGPFSEEHRRKLSGAQRGENGHTAKLTEKDVREIKALLQESILLQREIAARYGVARPTISYIKSGRNWAHLSMEDGEQRECAG